LNKDELRTLAEIGALNCFAAHRRDALWEAEKVVREDDLFSSDAPTLTLNPNLALSRPSESKSKIRIKSKKDATTALRVFESSAPRAGVNRKWRSEPPYVGCHE
jgi:DNA polymerase III alpha subunit